MNLLTNLDEFLSFKASNNLDRKQVHNPEDYFRKLAKKIGKIAEKPEEWIYQYQSKMPKQLLTLTKNQKLSLKKRVKDLHLGFEDLNDDLWLLCKILAYLEKQEQLETPFAETLIQNYGYLKNELSPKLYPKETKEFNKKLQQTEQKEVRPSCPKCGSNQLVSNGINWYCKNCKRQTVKHLL